jgi:hypothetical protein
MPGMRPDLDTAAPTAYHDHGVIAYVQPSGIVGIEVQALIGQRRQVCGTPRHSAGVVVLQPARSPRSTDS